MLKGQFMTTVPIEEGKVEEPPFVPDPAPAVKAKKIRADKGTWFESRNGKFYARITAPNGETVADFAEGYSTPRAALRALRRNQEKWTTPGGLVIFDKPEDLKVAKPKSGKKPKEAKKPPKGKEPPPKGKK